MRRLLLLSGSIVFLDTMFFAALTPLLPHYSDRFDLSKAGAGVLAAAYPAGVLVSALPSGLASVRFGVKRIAVGAMVIMSGTTVAFGFAGSIAVLDGARFAQGVASSCAWTAALAWLLAATPRERRGEMIGVALGVAIFGALFGPVLGGLASITSTRITFSVVGAAALALAAWAFATDAPPPRHETSLATFWRSLREPRIVAGVWLVALPALLFGTMSVLAPLRLSALGFGAVAIGAVYLVSAGFEAAASPLIGRLSDRMGRRLPITIGLAASAAVSALLPWPHWGVLLAIVVVTAGICFGIFWVPAMSLLTETAEAHGVDQAMALALVSLAWAPGQAVGAAAGGAVARASSDAVPYLVLAGVCLLTLLPVRRR